MQISTFSDAHEFISFLKSKVEHESPAEMTIENSWQKLINERDEPMKPSQIAAADVSMLTAEPVTVEAEPVDISMNSDPSSVIFDDIDFDELPFPSQITWTWTQEPDIAPADVIEKENVEDEQICDEFEFELDWALTQRVKTSQEQDEQPKEEFIGFTTGTGRALPPPSEEAMKRAQQLIEEPLSVNEQAKEEITFGFTTGKGKSLPPPSKEALERAKQLIEDTPPPQPPESFGFTTGKGKAMPPPSEAAMKRAQSLINEVEEPHSTAFSTGFSTGKGRVLPPPSEEAMKRAKSLIESADAGIENQSFSVGFSTGKGRTLPPPSKEALLKAQQLTSSSIDSLPAASFGFSSGNGRLLPPPSKEALERANRLIQSEEKENIPAPIVSIKPTPKPIISNHRSSLSTAFRRPRQQIVKPVPATSSSSSIILRTKPTSLFDLTFSQPRQKLAQYFSLPTRHSPTIYAQFNM